MKTFEVAVRSPELKLNANESASPGRLEGSPGSRKFMTMGAWIGAEADPLQECWCCVL
jgi:hypothetical protein